MRNAMGTVGKVCFAIFVTVASAVAQNQMLSAPSPAVAGPSFDVSVGYSHLLMSIPSAGRAGFNGLDSSASIGLGPRWGATVDSSFLRSSSVLGTSHQGYVLSLQGGPVFYPIEHGNTRVFIRGLVGASVVDGAVPISDNSYFHGWLVRPSYVAGGGIEHAVSGDLALRLNGDYLRTTFYDNTGVAQPQNSIRLTVSAVFRLKQHHHNSGAELR